MYVGLVVSYQTEKKTRNVQTLLIRDRGVARHCYSPGYLVAHSN